MADRSVLDRMARDRGFPDYDTMQAWYRMRAENTASMRPSGAAPQPATAQPTPQDTISNWFSMLVQNPREALVRILPQASGIQLAADALDKANKRQ